MGLLYDSCQHTSIGSIFYKFYNRQILHKSDVRLRLIISLPGTPSHNVARLISQILKRLIDSCDHSIKSSTQFLDKIKDLEVDNNELSVSFDFVELFTLVEPNLANDYTLVLVTNDPNLPKHAKFQSMYAQRDTFSS